VPWVLEKSSPKPRKTDGYGTVGARMKGQQNAMLMTRQKQAGLMIPVVLI
jgi:hypothetical protein